MDPRFPWHDPDFGNALSPVAAPGGGTGVSPVFINFVSIVISLGWSIGTFSVFGLVGSIRARRALLRPVDCPFTGLAGLTLGCIAAGACDADGKRLRHGDRYRRLQCASGGSCDGECCPRRSAQHSLGADFGPFARHCVSVLRSLGSSRTTAGLGDANQQEAGWPMR